eukprot:GFYU01000094.1.p1 GENE.GFYU01000094.1~~GFYU01000094.1.p1  ORF type:complete len:253 (+),score=44.68 GFYU01000094.1:323-1081(+)
MSGTTAKHVLFLVAALMFVKAVMWASGGSGRSGAAGKVKLPLRTAGKALDEDSSVIQVPRCSEGVYRIPHFVSGDGHSTVRHQTISTLCHDDGKIVVSYTAQDTLLWNTYHNCNDPLWEQEVVEMFLAEGHEVATHYLEVELSPFDVLYVSKITNTRGYCGSDLGHDMIDCAESGIDHTASKIAQGWQASLAVPLSLVTDDVTQTKFSLNLFRTDLATDDTHGPIEYSCASSTFADPPCFHVPKYFMNIELV